MQEKKQQRHKTKKKQQKCNDKDKIKAQHDTLSSYVYYCTYTIAAAASHKDVFHIVYIAKTISMNSSKACTVELKTLAISIKILHISYTQWICEQQMRKLLFFNKSNVKI